MQAGGSAVSAGTELLGTGTYLRSTGTVHRVSKVRMSEVLKPSRHIKEPRSTKLESLEKPVKPVGFRVLSFSWPSYDVEFIYNLIRRTKEST